MQQQGSLDAFHLVRRVFGHTWFWFCWAMASTPPSLCASPTQPTQAGWSSPQDGPLAVLCGVLVAQAFGSPGAHLNPAITISSAVSSGDYSQLLTLLVGAVAGRHVRSRTDGAALWPALEAHARPGSQARRLLHPRRNTKPALQLHQRSHRHHGIGAGGGSHLLSWSLRNRTGRRHGTMACGQPGVGHRPFAGRHHRLRHQPRARPWARGSPTPSCPFPAKAVRTGVTRPFRLRARWWAARWPASCCTSRTCKPIRNLRVSRRDEIRFPSAPQLFQAWPQRAQCPQRSGAPAPAHSMHSQIRVRPAETGTGYWCSRFRESPRPRTRPRQPPA